MTLSATIPTDLDATVEAYKRLRPIMTKLHSELSRLIKIDDLFACAKPGWRSPISGGRS